MLERSKLPELSDKHYIQFFPPDTFLMMDYYATKIQLGSIPLDEST